MNVFDAEKLELDIFIVRLVLVALASGPVCHGVNLDGEPNKTSMMSGLGANNSKKKLLPTYPWPRVNDVHKVAVGVRLAHRFQHLLILQTARTEAGQWLAAAADGRLVGVQIGERR